MRTTILLLLLILVGCSGDGESNGMMPILEMQAGPTALPIRQAFIEKTDATWHTGRLLYIDYAGIHCAAAFMIPDGMVILRVLYQWDEIEGFWVAVEGERPKGGVK